MTTVAFTTRPELRGTVGMAASTHWLASTTAFGVLERGGTAVDAAVAAGFVLHLVEPHLNGPGGDLTGLLSVRGGDPVVLDGQGPAPRAATIEHYRAEGLDEVPGAGPLAAAVPGAVIAWLTLLERHGTWELADVLAPAIDYARAGHPVLPAVTAAIEGARELFERHWPTSAARWLPGGRAPQPGELVTNPAYADVLERLVAAGAGHPSREARIRAALEVWQRGSVAEAMARAAHLPVRHSTGGVHAGVLGAADLADWTAGEEPAVRLRFRGVDVVKAGPWTQGPALLQCLAMLDQLPDDRLDLDTALGVHTVTEVLKLALADRDAWYGDPAASDVPMADLLSPEYAAERIALIGERASDAVRPGRPGGREPWSPPVVPASGATGPRPGGTGEPTLARETSGRGDTCHLDVVDRDGTMLSITPSGGWLQSSPEIPELGFCLGTRLQMTWLDAASPSALRPGARPRSTLSPTMLVRDGRPVEALGTPGGDQQDQWQLLYLLRRLVGGMGAQAAIDAPAFHTTAMVSSFQPRTVEPAGLTIESRYPDAVLDELRGRGHVVTVAGPWSLGRLSAVGRHPQGGVYGAANPRGAQGYAVGR